MDTTIDSNEKDFSNLPDTEIFRKIKSMVTQDHRIKDILLSYEEYPEELLEMLSKNIEMLEFVIDYPERKGKLYSDNIGEVTRGDIPLLLQWDQRWGYADYGNSSIAVSGCGPTALSMVIADSREIIQLRLIPMLNLLKIMVIMLKEVVVVGH